LKNISKDFQSNSKSCARNYANLLLKFRPRSIKELGDRLKRQGFSISIIAEVIEDYKKKGFLDDVKFAKLWAQERTFLKPAGRLLIKKELQRKGLAEEHIDIAINSVESKSQEYETAKELAFKRLTHLGKLSKLKTKKRLYDYLARRGFDYELIREVIGEVINNENR